MSHCTKRILSTMKPKYLTTIGICTGERDKLEQVYFFSNMKRQKGKHLEELQIVKNKLLLPIALWEELNKLKELGGPKSFIERPLTTSAIFTVHKSEVTENINAIKELLEHNECQAMDVEIWAMYTATEDWNHSRITKKCHLLPPIKGIGDFGTKEEHEKHKDKALQNVVKAFVECVHYYSKNKLLE